MQEPSINEVRQWKNVFVTHIIDSEEYPGITLKGTLFLTDHHDSKVIIHWVPDPDQDDSLPPGFNKSYEIDVQNLSQLTCRRLPGFRYRALYLILKNNHSYGPFEFRTGGATEFIRVLNNFADVKKSDENNTTYFVKFRPPVSYASLYELPSRNKLKTDNTLGGMAAFVEVGTSLRRVGRAVSGPMNNFFETILSSQPGTVRNSDEGYRVPVNTIDADRLRTTVDADFAIVDVKPSPVSLPPTAAVFRSEPLTMSQWKRFLDPYGRVTCVEKLRKIIFEGGIEPELRPLVWKYLLGYYLWDNTAEDNEKRRIEKHREYHSMKKFWKEMKEDRLARFSQFRERKCYIDKDVPRTDRKTSFFRTDANSSLTNLSDILLTYTVYNMDLGYLQGMNDLLAPILYVIQQEEDAFWCFVGLMERVESNFDENLNAIRNQFYQLFELVDVLDPGFSDYLERKNAKEMPFCFRWLLIHFKREFSYKDTMALWEAIWSEHRTKNFHIFFAAAVLLSQKSVIMSGNYDANSILKHINDLSYHIRLDSALNTATEYLNQLDQVFYSLPKSVQDIINGPSLAQSVHSIQLAGGGSISDDLKFDPTWGLLNDELEDLLNVDAPGVIDPTPGMIVALPTTRSDSSSGDISVEQHRFGNQDPVLTQSR